MSDNFGIVMKNLNMQDAFLNTARVEKIAITIFLTNGFQFKGYVKGFDNFTIFVEYENKQSLVYKHAVSTIIPSKPIHVKDSTKAEEAEL